MSKQEQLHHITHTLSFYENTTSHEVLRQRDDPRRD